MSGEVYFILIKDFQHKRKLKEVVAWLEKNVVLGHGEAERVDQELPFEIPMGFPSQKDAKEFSQKLEVLGCIIVIESLSQRKARAAQQEAAVQEELPPVPPVKNKASEEELGTAEKQDKEKEEQPEKKPLPIKQISIGLGALVALAVGWFAFNQFSAEDVKRVASKIDTTLISMQQEAGSGSPFSQVVGNMQAHIEKQGYSQEERQEHSSNYMGEVQGDKPVLNREVRQRNIMMIQASIAFYRKNGKAWRRLVDEYRAIGATLKVKELRKEMVEVFGEEETAEILEEE